MEIIEDDASSSSSSSQTETIDTLAPHKIKNMQEFNKKKRKAGRKKFKETRHPVYRGVRLRNGSKWVCEVREPNKKSRIWLGTFPNPEMAARAYDVAILASRGDDSPPLNFPDLAHVVKRAKSSSAQDIREAALEAALATDNTCSGNRQSLLSLSVPCGKVVVEVPDKVFVDEEALFNMPSFYNNMAEGLIITPPGMKSGFDWGEDFDLNIDLTLWRY